MTVPALLALAAAFWFAAAGIFLRRAIHYVTPPTAALFSVTLTTAFVWLVAAATVPLSRLIAPEVLFFLVAGLFAPGLARLVYYSGLARVGVARSAALISTAPIFAVALAVVALGEQPTRLALVGVACVVAGGVLLSQRALDDRTWSRWHLVFPLLAALGFALRDNFSRYGLATYPQPMIGAAGATLASVVLMWLLALARLIPIVIPPPAGFGFLALSGLCECFAYLTMWRALATADVSLVSPLVHAQPFFAVVLTAIFLRDVERVTWRIVVASLLIVAGVTFVLRSS